MRPATCACFVRILAIIATAALVLHSAGCKKKPAAVQAVPAPATNPAAQIVPVTAISPATAIDSRAMDEALRKGRAYLYRCDRNGQWGPPDARQPQIGTKTALVLRALLQAGEEPQGLKITAALKPMLTAPFTSTQAIADRLRLDMKLPLNAATKKLIKQDATSLLGSVSYKNDDWGFHPRVANSTEISLAASAQATTALAEAMECQIEIPSTYWHVTDKSWRLLLEQEVQKGPTVSPGGLSADDLKSLLRALDVLATTAEEVPSARADTKDAPADKLFDTALKQLESFYPDLYRGPGEFEAMELLSCIMRKRGKRVVAGHDWYHDGASLLLGIQRGDGSWGDGISDTAHAMLFLAESRAPVLFNKLQYASSSHNDRPAWNNHPRDLVHLTHWLSGQLERPFDWQVLNIDAPKQEWTTAPILYISGNTLLNFTQDQRDTLKWYIQQGGMIVGNADDNNVAFFHSFMKLGTQLFPQFEFRQLPPNHPVYNKLFPLNKAAPMPFIRGLSNGVRELMILLPFDQGRFWQMDQFAGSRARSCAELAANLVLYATDRNFKFKEDLFPHPLDPFPILAQTHASRPPINDAASLRASVRDRLPPIAEAPHKSATLAYITSDRDPATLPKFETLRDAITLNRGQLSIDPVLLGKFTLQRYETAAVTARQFSSLGALERLEIKRFIETGGSLLVEAWKEPEKVPLIETQLSKLFTDPKLTFGPRTPGDTLLPNKFEVRIGRYKDRGAVMINTHASQSDEILQRLLEARMK